MPSKAIGMGVCPRCGKPGTIVIKAGNYVYIKHGNTWHYIGTIDKVNLNKILIKNPENIATSKPKQKNKYTAIALITIATAMVILSIALLFTLHNNSYNEFTFQGDQEGNNLNNMVKLVAQCNYTTINSASALLCNNTNYKITIININAIKNISLYNLSNIKYYGSNQ